MKTIKKILSIGLSLMFLLTLSFHSNALSNDFDEELYGEYSSKKYSILLNSKGEAKIWRNYHYSPDKIIDIVIPKTLASYPIKAIGFSAFSRFYSLKSLTIHGGIEQIDDLAFSDCHVLEKVTITYGVKEIGYGAFIGCHSLPSITFPSSVTTLGDRAFEGCTNLETATFKSSTTKIGKNVFEGCEKLTIIGYAGSTAEKYAKKNNIPFKTLAKSSNVTLSATSYVYDGKAKKPTVTVRIAKKTLTKDKDYTVSYPKGRTNVGKYTVTVKFKGNYSGTVKKTFAIKPKPTKVTKVTAKSKGFKLTWSKRIKQVDGYQIQYSTNNKFEKNNKTLLIKDDTKTSRNITKLKGKKTYYARVRTYKIVKVGGKNTVIYSKWSRAQSVKTLK